MPRPDSIESVSFTPPEKKEANFHAIYFDYVSILNMLNFINDKLNDFFSGYFNNWLSTITNKIEGFTNDEKNELKKCREFFEIQDKARIFANGFKIDLTSQNTKSVLAELDDYYDYSINSTKLLRSIMLVHVITSFEEFLQDVLSLLYHVQPEILKKSDKKMDFEEILEFDDIHELSHSMMEKQLEGLFNEGLDAIKKYLNDKTGLDLSKYEKWNEIRERYARRNVIIHNHGEPNKRYFKFINEIPKTVDLSVDQNYLQESFTLFSRFAHHITDYYEIRFGTKQHDSTKIQHAVPTSYDRDEFIISLFKSLQI